jgi:predicted phage tail protein
MKNLNFLGLSLSIIGALIIASGIIFSALLQAANINNLNSVIIFIVGAAIVISGIICLFINKDKK